jgi:protein-tyrosine-phosphatase
MHILFVCCGNRERSLIAENLLRQKLGEDYPQLFEKVEISSAGIFPKAYLEEARKLGITFVPPYFGKSPNIYAVKFLAEKGIDVSSYYSRELTKRMVRKADLILAMDRVLKNEILGLQAKTSAEIWVLKEFVFGPDCPNPNIGDPMKFPEIDKKTGVWIWPEGYAADYIFEIERCFAQGLKKFMAFIKGEIPPL